MIRFLRDSGIYKKGMERELGAEEAAFVAARDAITVEPPDPQPYGADAVKWTFNRATELPTGARASDGTIVDLEELIPGSTLRVPQVSAVADTTGIQIGVPGNFFEALADEGRIPNAVIYTAPVATPITTAVDMGAYWYNDFGLEATRLDPNAWKGWNDGRWNHRNTDGYVATDWTAANYGVGETRKGSDGKVYTSIQAMTAGSPKDPANGANPTFWSERPTPKYYPDRHCLLGHYRGDDPKIISWQVKWSVEHGITWAVVQQRTRQPDDNGNWINPSSYAHWVYHLSRDKAVQAGLFKLAFWLPHSSSEYGIFNAINDEWSSATAYTPGMRVATFSNGSATYYRCILSHTNQAVSNTTYWLPIPEYNPATPYVVDDVVYRIVSGALAFYVCIQNGTGQLPAANTAYWRGISNYNSNVSYLPGMVVLANSGDNRQYVANGSGTGLGAPSSSNANWTRRVMPASWRTFVDWHVARAAICKTITKGGKTYLATFLMDQDIMRSTANTNAFVDYMKQLGAYVAAQNPAWSGIAIFCRNSNSPTTAGGSLNYEALEADGNVLMLRTEYPGHVTSTGATNFAELVSKFPTFAAAGAAARQDKRVYNPISSLETVPPHDSVAYRFSGHTPELCGAMTRKMRDYAASGNGFVGDDGRPVLLGYNIAEWAEGGPSISQPNMQDGFGYPQAVKAAIT